MRISDWSSDVCSSDLADHQRPEQGIGDIQIGVGRSPAIGEIVEDFIARLGQDDTKKGYEAAIRPACNEQSNQENEEHDVDMEAVVGEPSLFADPQEKTIIFLRVTDVARDCEEHYLSEG